MKGKLMSYVISFSDETEKFVMNGREEHFIGKHLYDIAVKEGLEGMVCGVRSESHMLSILTTLGTEIELVDIDW